MMRFFLLSLLVLVLLSPIVYASVQVYPSVYYYVNGYYVVFTENNFTKIILGDDKITVEYLGRNISFKPENANLTITVTQNTITIKAYAPSGAVSKIYVWGFKPNRVLLNNSGVKRVLSLKYLAPNSYYMNQTTIVLCGEHHSVLVWRLLVLPTYAGGGGGVLAIAPTTTQLAETTTPSKLNIALNKQAVIGIIVLLVLVGSLYLVASSSKRW